MDITELNTILAQAKRDVGAGSNLQQHQGCDSRCNPQILGGLHHPTRSTAAMGWAYG